MVRFRLAYWRFRHLERSYRRSLVWGMQKAAEETALNSPSEIDTRAFMWTLDNVKHDYELERFFSGLPGFRSSKLVDDPLPRLTGEEMQKLFARLRGLLDLTFSSDLLPAAVKDRRALICAKAVEPLHTQDTFNILHAILSEYQHSGPIATAIATILRGWEHYMDQDKIVYAICKVIATKQPFDDSWYNLASEELGFSKTSLRHYAARGDSLSLVILNYAVRQQFTHFRKSSWDKSSFSLVLATASNFNVNDTSPELRHGFCALWNEIVHEAQENDGQMAFYILRQIRNVFLALHQGTNSAPTQFSASTSDGDAILFDPFSYPRCRVPDHQSHSTPHFHEPSTSGPSPNSNVSPSPPDDVPGGRTELGRAPSDDLSVRSSPFPAPFVEDILPTGLLLFSGRDSI